MEYANINKSFGSIMIIVPHEDDELLLSAGIIRNSVKQNLKTTVVMATNGDYGSTDYSIGKTRLKETIESVEYLGLPEEDVIFLGYADTGMIKEQSFITKLYEEKDENKIFKSHCSSKTYGLVDKKDYHYINCGENADYTRKNFYEDLKTVIFEYRPDNIFTTSKFDIHGDHSGLYDFIVDILKELNKEMGYLPNLFSGIVHSGDGDDNWPKREEKIDFLTSPEKLHMWSSLKWNDRIIFQLPQEMMAEKLTDNMKYQAISKHKTALKPDAVDFLYSFVKKDEVFWRIDF